MSYWYNWFSWWWAYGCLKHVEIRNKHVRKKIVHHVGYLQELYRYAWSTEHTIILRLVSKEDSVRPAQIWISYHMDEYWRKFEIPNVGLSTFFFAYTPNVPLRRQESTWGHRIEGNEREAATEVATSTPESRGMLLSHNALSIRNFTVKQIGNIQRRTQIALMGLNWSRYWVEDVPFYRGRYTSAGWQFYAIWKRVIVS
jgi:hypothetical protein